MTIIVIVSTVFTLLLGIVAYFIPLCFKRRQPKEQNPSCAILNHFHPIENEFDLNEFVRFSQGLPETSKYKIKN